MVCAIWTDKERNKHTYIRAEGYVDSSDWVVTPSVVVVVVVVGALCVISLLSVCCVSLSVVPTCKRHERLAACGVVGAEAGSLTCMMVHDGGGMMHEAQ